jgi:twitching motility protein PilJ
MQIMKMRGVTANQVLGILALLAIAATAAVFVRIAVEEKNLYEHHRMASQQRLISYRIAHAANEVGAGRIEAMDALRRARGDFERTLKVLHEGDASKGLPPASPQMAGELVEVDSMWLKTSKQIDQLLHAGPTIAGTRDQVHEIGNSVPSLLALSDEVVGILADSGASGRLVEAAGRMRVLLVNIEANADRILGNVELAVTAADRVGRDAARFHRLLRALLEGDQHLQIAAVTNTDARARLQRLLELYQPLAEHIDGVMEHSPELFDGLQAAAEVARLSTPLFDASNALAAASRDLRDAGLAGGPQLGYTLALVALLLLGAMAWHSRKEALRRLAESTEHNRRNQEAILMLLDEMGDIADGDLTVQATITEEITGAIADSVNYAIEALRELVGAINETAVQVSSAADLTRSTATGLLESSARQKHEITEAGTAIERMAQSIGAISTSAVQSAKAAERAVSIAHRGAEAVENNVRGMDVIREQIQETAKRIKRLGESTQQIGDIVGLIDDIAEQTNILALNAAIQAATAGEAGRGFAVVADEVQRLAERSGGATKQIESLVRTIQADTQEAVLSMEQTTTNVVAGAALAGDAGAALQEIQRVSKDLEVLVQGFARSARQQAVAADRVRANMDVIREITEQTSVGTASTASAIGQLAELAERLRGSVAGFKLPA